MEFDYRKFLTENRLTTTSRLISEAEEEGKATEAAEEGLEDALGSLQSAANSVKPSAKDGDVKEGVGTIYSLVVGAPGILNVLGKGADLIGKTFTGGKVKSTKVGAALKKAGHSLEHKYIAAIGAILKKAYPKKFGKEDVDKEGGALNKAAHGVYAALLAAGAITAGLGAVDATNTIIKGLEGGAVVLKTSEVAQLAQKIAGA